MKRSLVLAGGGFVLTAAPAWAAEKKFSPIDVQPKASHRLVDSFHSSNPGNNLAQVPKGEQLLAGVRFQIGERCVQLGSPILERNGFEYPKGVTGIPVGKRCARLYFLHALGYGVHIERNPEALPRDRSVAKYTVHYEDGSKEVIPVIYGRDITDWWYAPGSELHTAEPTHARVAWEGTNDSLKDAEGRIRIRLYVMTWENPRPEKTLKATDFATSDPDLPSAPFCVAITAEE
jgi:hypothetical protein